MLVLPVLWYSRKVRPVRYTCNVDGKYHKFSKSFANNTIYYIVLTNGINSGFISTIMPLKILVMVFFTWYLEPISLALLNIDEDTTDASTSLYNRNRINNLKNYISKIMSTLTLKEDIYERRGEESLRGDSAGIKTRV